MKRNYKFYESEAIEPKIISFDLPVPFHKNLDKNLKEQYGEDLTFVKEINHKERIIRLHNQYDSGKGTIYVTPLKRKKPRTRIDIKIKEIFSDIKTQILEIKMNGYINLVVMFTNNGNIIYKNATIKNGIISGYFVTKLSKERTTKYLVKNRYYPDEFKWHKT